MIDQETLTNEIKTNLEQIAEKMNKAAVSAGRNVKDVKLVVVTKKKSVTVIESAIAAGITLFGENYPEQAVPKIEVLKGHSELKWHMIGHLQSRKAALVVQNFHMMHSLDSVRLARKLESLLALEDKTLPVLLEFNVGGETSKHGWAAQDETKWHDLVPEIQSLQEFTHLEVCGLMTMPPYEKDIEKVRQYFVKLARLRDFLSQRISGMRWEELSMGTSIDYEAAIQEGATFIRIGQAILGARL